MNLAEPEEALPASNFIASKGFCINSFPKQNSAVSFYFLLKEAKESIFPFGLTSEANFHGRGRRMGK